MLSRCPAYRTKRNWLEKSAVVNKTVFTHQYFQIKMGCQWLIFKEVSQIFQHSNIIMIKCMKKGSEISQCYIGQPLCMEGNFLNVENLLFSPSYYAK